MRAFQFIYGPKVLSGADGAARLGELLPVGPCLFVTDPDIIRLDLAEPWLAALRETREVALFSAVEADPSRATLLAAVEQGRASDARSVVGFGGGSPMDVAKLAAYLLGSGDDVDAIWGVEIAQGSRLPLV